MFRFILSTIFAGFLPTGYSNELDIENLDSTAAVNWVRYHNAMRTNVEPAAKFMPKVEWDEDLASLAQRFASSCQATPTTIDYRSEQYNKHTNSGKEVIIGENIAVTTDTFSAHKVIYQWWNQKWIYEYETNSCHGKSCVEYTQAIWADTQYIGCATHLCAVDYLQVVKGHDEAHVTICLYLHGGNHINQRPYEKSE